MTSILLIVIGIALTAAAALMMFFYGGGAFDMGSVRTRAVTLDNAAMSVVTAARLHMAERSSVPADMTALVTSAYLSRKPQLDGVGRQSDSWRTIGMDHDGKGGRLAYVVDDVPGEVCLALLKLHRQDDIAVPSTPGRSATGCYQESSGSDAVFYAYLPGDGQVAAASGETPAGGEASRPDDGRQAAEVRLVGATVAAAGRGFVMATGRLPRTDADLAPDYVTAIPRAAVASAQSWSYGSSGDAATYRLLVPDTGVCAAINASLGHGPAVLPSADGVSEGCYRDSDLGLVYLIRYGA